MKLKKILINSALTGAILFNTGYAAEPVERETNNQIALLQSLTLGYFDGSITVGELKNLGNIGIGTFEGLNGELIMLDGVVYRANQDLKINVVEDKVTVPFSNVTFFEKDFSVKLKNISGKNSLETKFNELVEKSGVNSFYFVKIPATFKKITVRSEEGQKKPYPTLVEALTATQKEQTFENINGTIVGLYCPPYMGELNSVGWHFHFISSDKTVGGHVLELNIATGTAEFDKTNNFNLKLPKRKNFQSLDLAQDLREDIHKAENDSTVKNQEE